MIGLRKESLSCLWIVLLSFVVNGWSQENRGASGAFILVSVEGTVKFLDSENNFCPW